MSATGRQMDRRRFLSLAACGSMGLTAAGLWTRQSGPVPLPVIIGALGEMPRGLNRTFPELGLAMIWSNDGLTFISTRCTHLGCTVRLVGDELICPCHQGRFSLDGSVLDGPPPRPLVWLRGGISARGQVFVYPGGEDEGRRPIPVGPAGLPP